MTTFTLTVRGIQYLSCRKAWKARQIPPEREFSASLNLPPHSLPPLGAHTYPIKPIRGRTFPRAIRFHSPRFLLRLGLWVITGVAVAGAVRCVHELQEGATSPGKGHQYRCHWFVLLNGLKPATGEGQGHAGWSKGVAMGLGVWREYRLNLLNIF